MWLQRLKSRTSDADRSGCPVQTTIPGILIKFHDMVNHEWDLRKFSVCSCFSAIDSTFIIVFYYRKYGNITTLLMPKTLRTVPLSHGNAQAKSSVVEVAKWMELGFQLNRHPSRFSCFELIMFPNTKKWLAGQIFYLNEHAYTWGNKCLLCEIEPNLLFISNNFWGRRIKYFSALHKLFKPP